MKIIGYFKVVLISVLCAILPLKAENEWLVPTIMGTAGLVSIQYHRWQQRITDQKQRMAERKQLKRLKQQKMEQEQRYLRDQRLKIWNLDQNMNDRLTKVENDRAQIVCEGSAARALFQLQADEMRARMKIQNKSSAWIKRFNEREILGRAYALISRGHQVFIPSCIPNPKIEGIVDGKVLESNDQFNQAIASIDNALTLLEQQKLKQNALFEEFKNPVAVEEPGGIFS